MDPNTVYDYPNNLVDLFEESVTRFPDIRFMGTKNPESGKYEWLSRKQIAERVDNLRGALKKHGLSKGDKAGIADGAIRILPLITETPAGIFTGGKTSDMFVSVEMTRLS